MFVPLLVTDFLRRAVRQYGKKVGVIDGDKRYTYAQFGERVNRLSNGLLKLGIGKGDRVAVIDSNSHRYLELYYGVPQIGAVLLPVNIRLSAKDITYVLNNAEANCLFLNEELGHLVQLSDLDYIKKIVMMRDRSSVSPPGFASCLEYEDLLAGSSPLITQNFEINESDPAEMFYTSGTTSRPKGMLHSHRALYLATLKDMCSGSEGFGINDSTVYLQAIPLFHANGWRKAHVITGVGARHVILRQFRPELVCNLVQQEKIDYMEMVPTMADILTGFEDIDRYDLSTVKRIVLSGSPLLKKTHQALISRFRNAAVLTGYGMSETASAGTVAVIKDYLRGLPEEEKERRMRMQGFEDFITQIRVVDFKGQDVKWDGKQTGEMVFRGNTIIDEYWKLPEASKNTLVDGWLHSGDVATIDEDGYINIVDRLKDMINSGGEKISSVEIEEVIGSHLAVKEVAVVAAPSEKWGETPAAVVVLKDGESLTEQELLQYCRDRLASFKVPRIIQFRSALPKGGTGKILKGQIKNEFWTPGK